MLMHHWSEKEFDWDALNEACYYLNKMCRRWGRLGVWTKEKYGTMRVQVWMGVHEPIENFLFPGYAHVHFPAWFRTYIDFPLGDFLHFTRIAKLIYWYQNKVLKFFWKRAAKKWPHIAKEILYDYEWITGQKRPTETE